MHSKLKGVVTVSSGNFLEMYDFMVFGYYAAAIATTFFPGGSQYASLMLSLMTFGAGFLMRPLGAVVLGSYIDRHGRRAGLLLTLGLMAIGTGSIAIVPGYATLGIVAPLLILTGRLLQGLSAGAELGGVSVYLSEIATPEHKGFYVSWQSASQQVAVMFAALLGILMASTLPQAEVMAWGWRIPLLVGCLLIPFLFLIRRSLVETEAFLARARRPSFVETLHSIRVHWRLVALGTMLVTMTTVSFYFITAYTPTFGAVALKLGARSNMLVTLCVGASNFLLLPAMGALSDRAGRRPLMIVSTVLAMVTAYPVLLWLAAQPSFARLLAVELWLSILYATYNGAMVVYLTEIMPVEVRTTGFSLAYSLATALFGGFTPAMSTYLIHATNNPAMPGVWLSGAAACAFIATMILAV
ncbi:MAG TPA: MFS transporter [Vicinamibacterales bacterium]|nr:MFS transporter [Vicinamibacterales bacterium]